MTRSRAMFVVFLLASCVAACGGIPILSIPKLIALQGKLIDANPEEFMVAIQADARVAPPAGSSPVLSIDIKPKAESDFPRVQRLLDMQATEWSPRHKGLAPAATGRKWLVYAFTPESAAELRRMQKTFRDLKGKSQGGSVTLGISQESIAARSPGLANTKWESWLQASRADGFFELWSGKLGDLLARAEPR
jgi:hypothetical protein